MDGLRVLVFLMKRAYLGLHNQNGVVKRQNRTLMEAARTMLILFAGSSTVLWAESCTSGIGSCVSYQDYDDVGILKAESDIGIFVRYAPTNGKAYDSTSKDAKIQEPFITELELTALQSWIRSRSVTSKRPKPPSSLPTKENRFLQLRVGWEKLGGLRPRDGRGKKVDGKKIHEFETLDLGVGTKKHDGYKAKNVNLKRRYEELSKSNAYSCSTFTAKINALTAENAKLKTELSGKKSSGSTAFEKPKVLASGMYTNSSKTSNTPTQKPPVQQNKKPNVPVNLSTRTKPATESRKPMPKSHTRNHRILPSKSVNARRAADHNRKLNVVDHNQFVIHSLKSVNTKTPQAKHSVNHTKKVWKATRNHNVNTTKTAWRPTGKVVGSVKPQWKPTA
ncbi:hypothetical protein Tco_0481075 [Tanacetum coccineum]